MRKFFILGLLLMGFNTPVWALSGVAQLFDGEDLLIGQVLDAQDAVVEPTSGQIVSVTFDHRGFTRSNNGVIYYTTGDCSGTAYWPAEPSPPIAFAVTHNTTPSPSVTFHYPTLPYSLIAVASIKDVQADDCSSASQNSWVGVMDTFTLDFTAPFKAE